MRGIFAIDPGGSTGVAWGVFDETAPTARDAIQDRIDPTGSATIRGTEIEQIKALYELWEGFKHRCHRQFMDPEWIDLVIEDFVLLPGAHAGGKEGVSPVRIAWGFDGYRLGHGDRWRGTKHVTTAIWQPAAAMKFERNLRDWGVWIRGKQHERSAWCHVGARLMKLMR